MFSSQMERLKEIIVPTQPKETAQFHGSST